MMLDLVPVDHILKDVTRSFVSTYPSWLSGYQAWLVWLLNKSPELNHLKHFGDFSLPRKIALIVLKLWNLVKNREGAEGRTLNLEIAYFQTSVTSHQLSL